MKPSKFKSAKIERNAAPEQRSFDLIMGARLARQLGISPVTLWKWRQKPDFPTGRRIGQRVFFSVPEVQAWLDHQQAA
jgi:predicted DNA-binding transcriptional regulator AlpA